MLCLTLCYGIQIPCRYKTTVPTYMYCILCLSTDYEIFDSLSTSDAFCLASENKILIYLSKNKIIAQPKIGGHGPGEPSLWIRPWIELLIHILKSIFIFFWNIKSCILYTPDPRFLCAIIRGWPPCHQPVTEALPHINHFRLKVTEN